MVQPAITGLVFGMLSSLHCVGMCGPLALALPVHHLAGNRARWAVVLYNSGRVITYSAMGLILGLSARRIYLAGYQQGFSIALGVLMLVLSLHYFLFKTYWQPAWLSFFQKRVLQWMSALLQPNKIHGYLLLGMCNGLLPCGMVYLALAGALSLNGISETVLFMASFGLGTLPAMVALSYFGIQIRISARNKLKQFMPYLALGMAMILILRGLNLGIPFISPALAGAPHQMVSCP